MRLSAYFRKYPEMRWIAAADLIVWALVAGIALGKAIR